MREPYEFYTLYKGKPPPLNEMKIILKKMKISSWNWWRWKLVFPSQKHKLSIASKWKIYSYLFIKCLLNVDCGYITIIIQFYVDEYRIAEENYFCFYFKYGKYDWSKSNLYNKCTLSPPALFTMCTVYVCKYSRKVAKEYLPFIYYYYYYLLLIRDFIDYEIIFKILFRQLSAIA